MFEIQIVSLLDFLTFTFSISNSNLCLLAVAFLTLPSGSKSKVAGLVNVDKHVCRLLALRHLGGEYKRGPYSSILPCCLLSHTVAEGEWVRFNQESLPPVLYLPVERVRVCLKIVATCLSKDMRSKYN